MPLPTVSFFSATKAQAPEAYILGKTGFWLAQKRLERNTWPDNSEEARQITPEQIEMLLCGIDFWRAHEEIKFSSVF